MGFFWLLVQSIVFCHSAFLGSPQDKHSFDACSLCLLKVLYVKSHLIHRLTIKKVCLSKVTDLRLYKVQLGR